MTRETEKKEFKSQTKCLWTDEWKKPKPDIVPYIQNQKVGSTVYLISSTDIKNLLPENLLCQNVKQHAVLQVRAVIEMICTSISTGVKGRFIELNDYCDDYIQLKWGNCPKR